MIDDISVNFMKFVKNERYFNSIDKNKKGSGFKDFMRWKNNTEYVLSVRKPSTVDPYHATKP